MVIYLFTIKFKYKHFCLQERRILAAASAAYNAREHAALFQDGAL